MDAAQCCLPKLWFRVDETACFHKTALSNERLAYAKHTLPKSSVVSSTRDATFLTNCRLVYAKHPLWEAKPSRAQPSPAEPSRSEPSKNPQRKIKLCLVYAKHYFFLTSRFELRSIFEQVRFVYAKQHLFVGNRVSSTRNTHFRRARRAEPSRAEPSRAEPSGSNCNEH